MYDVYVARLGGTTNANYPTASYTPEAVYDTVDLSTGGAITGGDDFTVWYMS